MLKKIVLVFAAVALAKAQLPSLGWCPDYVPMTNFELGKFLGVWYEAERYFQLSEVVSRCVTTNYTLGPDGKVRVSNEVTNRFTGIKRVLEGEIKPPASKSEEGHLKVKYNSVPFTPETNYVVLDTDYDDFAVLWSCSGIGPVHAQNAWLMTRKRIADPATMQKAYGVLDKFKIWKTYFVKTDQLECGYEAPPIVVTPAPASAPAQASASAPAQASASAPASAPVAAASSPVKEEPEAVPAQKSAEAIYLRSASILEGSSKDETRKEETEVSVKAADPVAEKPAEVPAEEKPVLAEEKIDPVSVKAVAPETIPEVILKVAESAKEIPAPIVEPALPVAEESKIAEVAIPAESQPDILAVPQSPEQVPEATAEEPKVKIAQVEQAKPVEVPVAAEAAEESKPVEAIPALKSPPATEAQAPLAAEPVAAEKIEAPVQAAEAVAVKSEEEVKIVDPPLEKTVELPKADEPKEDLPKEVESEKISSPEAAVLRETVAEPAAKEALVLPAETPLSTVQESKPEVIAAEVPKTPETKP